MNLTQAYNQHLDQQTEQLPASEVSLAFPSLPITITQLLDWPLSSRLSIGKRSWLFCLGEEIIVCMVAEFKRN